MPAVLIVAGEPSGDELAAELVVAARAIAPDVVFLGATGPALEEAGAQRVVPTSDLSVMGLFEVVRALPTAWRALKMLERAAMEREVVGAVLVDSPDFNLRLARRLSRGGIPVVQYVGPTVWAWRRGRIRILERHVRRLLVTLPFEPRVYAGTGIEAVYVGNPARDRIPDDPEPRRDVARRLGLDPERPWVAIAPGSRAVELARMGPLLAAAAARIRAARPDVELVAPVARGASAAALARVLAEGPMLRLVEAGRLDVLAHCAAGLATSGTVSLELALLGVPHVVAYRTSTATYALARFLVDVEHIALPNLIAGRRLVPEFVQGAATPAALADPVLTWLADPAAAQAVRQGLAEVAAAVGPPGAGSRAARSALAALGLTGRPTSGDLAFDPTTISPDEETG